MTLRQISRRVGGLIGAHPLIFAILTAWAFAPLVVLLIYAGSHGGELTGASGTDAFDQLAYLAWIRDEGSHVLASNLWQLAATPHDYLHPMFVISGLLWRLGLSIQLSYMVWMPVGLIVLFAGFAAYVHHLLPDNRRHQAAALCLGLFYVTPVLALAAWTGHLTPAHRYDLVLVTDDAYSALNLWGFDHTAIAIGLMPVFLVAAEARLRVAGREPAAARRWTVIAAIAGLLVSWLHPWQGVTLLGVLGGLAVVKAPRRRYFALTVPVLATLLPLLYGFVLSHADPAWGDFQSRTTGTGTAPWWALTASLGPLALLGVIGLRRPHEDRDWMLVLWVLACSGVYFVFPEFPPHALSGVTLPLAVLAVRGWQRLPLTGRAALPSRRGNPGVHRSGGDLPRTGRARRVPSLDRRRRRRASVDDPHARPGAGDVLPRAGAAAGRGSGPLVPLDVGAGAHRPSGLRRARHVAPGSQVAAANRFFSPSLNDPAGAARRAILRASNAAYVIADCGAPPALGRAIAPVAAVVRRFGCVTVYRTL